MSGIIFTIFRVTRIIQIICLIPLVGIMAHLVSFLIGNNIESGTAWHLTVFALSFACISTLYCGLSLLILLDGSLPMIHTVAADLLLMIPAVVIVALMGNWANLDRLSCNFRMDNAQSAWDFVASIGSNLDELDTGSLPFSMLPRTSQSNCRETKSAWALHISLCILYFTSAVTSALLWSRKRKGAAKDVRPA